MAAVTWVELTKVVVRELPFHRTLAPVANPVPFTARLNAAAPTVTDAGLTDVMAGAAVGGGAAGPSPQPVRKARRATLARKERNVGRKDRRTEFKGIPLSQRSRSRRNSSFGRRCVMLWTTEGFNGSRNTLAFGTAIVYVSARIVL
jgi:hypothetical protein